MTAAIYGWVPWYTTYKCKVLSCLQPPNDYSDIQPVALAETFVSGNYYLGFDIGVPCSYMQVEAVPCYLLENATLVLEEPGVFPEQYTWQGVAGVSLVTSVIFLIHFILFCRCAL